MKGDMRDDMRDDMIDDIKRKIRKEKRKWIGKIRAPGASKPCGKKLPAGMVEMKST